MNATLDAITHLVHEARPSWPPTVILAVLEAHAHHLDSTDLAIAALRAAKNPAYHSPKTIGWRGPHWDGLGTMPSGMMTSRRCGVCGRFEDQCLTTRIGRDDDHEFEPVEPRDGRGRPTRPPVR